MAGKITVNRFVGRLGKAVHRYVGEQQIASDHVATTAIFDPNSGRIYLNVALDVPINDTQWSQGIREEIRKEFNGVAPDVTELGLVVWQVDDLEIFLDSRIVADDDLDLTDMLNAHG